MYFLPWALKAASREHFAPFLPLPPVLGVELGLGLAAAAEEEAATTTALEISSGSATGVDVGAAMSVSSVESRGADEGAITMLEALLEDTGAADGATTMLVALLDGTGAAEGSVAIAVVPAVGAGSSSPPSVDATHWLYQSLYLLQLQPSAQAVSPSKFCPPHCPYGGTAARTADVDVRPMTAK
jgi:hypothetical protein